MSATIQEAIAQARAAAATMPQEGALVEGIINDAGVVTTFARPTMAAVAAATSVIPRNTPYIKVNEFGILIGKQKKGFIDGFKAKILMQEGSGFALKYTLRFGNPAQYLSSYDGVVCDKGGSWHDAMMKAKRIDPRAEPYISVDVVMTLAADLKAGEETLPAGTKIGFNSSKTNFNEWSDFFNEVQAAGLVNQTVDVKIGYRDIEHNGNTWGVLTFAQA
jgi:hypothetical protein